MLNSKKTKKVTQIDPDNIPSHVAIIMDGNGRWAKKRYLPRIAGHKQGMETVKTITKTASHMGIKVLTLYAFSTENWKRPKDEVSYIMSLPGAFFDKFVPELIENNVSVRVMGMTEQLPKQTLAAVNKAVEQTSHCTGMILTFALNYGARMEITNAVKEIALAAANHEIDPVDIDENMIADHLMTAFLGDLADPDLLIRTSGEERISNFLLWQIAYSEFIFSETLWPDFDADTFEKLVIEYQGRHRRFGGLEKESKK